MSADIPRRVQSSHDPKPTKEALKGWLAEHGHVLFRYAMKRVGSADVAEDLVQDTFVAALRSWTDFEGRSKVQTWLVGILRHKIADHLRRLSRQKERDAEPDQVLQVFQNGTWRVGLKEWPADPSRFVENKEFWDVLRRCEAKLPAKLAAPFRMRDLEELAMADICEILDISPTNLSVRLHRARVLLRDCLDQHWFSIERRS